MKFWCLILVGCLAFLGCAEDSNVKSVAPYAFYDRGDFIEIVGSWNYRGVKHETGKLLCIKALMVCADYTASVEFDHLNLTPMVWEVEQWGETMIVARSGISGMYENHKLCIDRKNQTARILSPKDVDCRNNRPDQVVEVFGQPRMYSY